MKLRDYLTKIAPKALYYEATRRGWVQPVNPLTLTFSVTAACKSRCKTCYIGKVYLENPEIANQNLTLEEIEWDVRIFFAPQHNPRKNTLSAVKIQPYE